MESLTLTQLGALSHPHRLALFRLLVRRLPDDVPAGEIAAALKCKPNTTSVYLSTLMNGGLVSKRRQGTSLFYRANLNAAQEMMQFLFSDCCRDRVALSMPAYGHRAQDSGQTGLENVLFICSGNSARSLCAEAILRDLMPLNTAAYSAGTRPANAPNPLVLELLQAHGHDTEALHCKETDVFRRADAPQMDVVITLCDHAANAQTPAWDGQPLSSHWGIEKPTQGSQTTTQQRAAYDRMYRQLADKIARFSKLNLETLPRTAFQAALDSIGRHPNGPYTT